MITSNRKGDIVVVTLGTVTVEISGEDALSAGQAMVEAGRQARQVAHVRALRAGSAEAEAKFRELYPGAVDIATSRFGRLVVSARSITQGNPWAFVADKGVCQLVECGDIPEAAPVWLVDKNARSAHIWRGGDRTACGKYKSETKRAAASWDARCPKCAALEAK